MAPTQPVFGATITPPATTKPVTTPITTTDLPPDTTGPHTSPPAVTPASLRQPSFDITTATGPPPIYSPFYEHPPASHERILTPITTPAAVGSDVEKNEKTGPATFTRTVSSPDDCSVWPSRAAQQRARSRQRSTSRAAAGGILATPMRRLRRRCGELSSRTRLLLKLALALVLCGIVVAVGVGISVSVHGAVYVGNGNAATVEGPHSR